LPANAPLQRAASGRRRLQCYKWLFVRSLRDSSGSPPAICSRAIRNTPANVPPSNASATHQIETIAPPNELPLVSVTPGLRPGSASRSHRHCEGLLSLSFTLCWGLRKKLGSPTTLCCGLAGLLRRCDSGPANGPFRPSVPGRSFARGRVARSRRAAMADRPRDSRDPCRAIDRARECPISPTQRSVLVGLPHRWARVRLSAHRTLRRITRYQESPPWLRTERRRRRRSRR